MNKKSLIILIILLLIGAGTWFFLSSRSWEAPPEVKVEAPKVVRKTIGSSVEKRPIESFTYGTGSNEIVLVGGIHGGYEWNSVLLSYQIMDYLEKNLSTIPENIKITIIPNMNPDGVYKVTGKTGRFAVADVSTDKWVLASGRFNANDVDLNRNFDCNWQSESKWQSKTVSAGTAPFSEPEALAIKNFALSAKPSAFVFFHSQANAVYASQCNGPILPQTAEILSAYSASSGYPKADTFTSYQITGDVTDWLASIGIPGISVELKTHETIEFEQNLAGLKTLIEYYSQ